MEYKKAITLQPGDIVAPRSTDINGVPVSPQGNYVVKSVQIQGRDVFITVDNGQVVNSKLCNSPTLKSSVPFYCSWFGYSKDICDTGLSQETLERLGIEAPPRGLAIS